MLLDYLWLAGYCLSAFMLGLLFGMGQQEKPVHQKNDHAWKFKVYKSHLFQGGECYMKRWIFHHPFGTIRLHKIMRSDSDRHFHDHPWNFWSFILKGTYHEHVPCVWCAREGKECDGSGRMTRGSIEYSAPAINRKRATALHYLKLDKPVWTLVFTGRRWRKWGFQTENGWVYWRDYGENYYAQDGLNGEVIGGVENTAEAGRPQGEAIRTQREAYQSWLER